MGLKVLNPLIKTVAKKAYVAPKIEVKTLESLGLKVESIGDIFHVKETGLHIPQKTFDFLPWRQGYKYIPRVGKPPQYTEDAKRVTKLFENTNRVDEKLPNGFRFCAQPRTKVGENGEFLKKDFYERVGAKGLECLFLDKNSKGFQVMVDSLNNIIGKNPNITDKQKAQLLKEFVENCFVAKNQGLVSKFSSDYLSISQITASGAGVCRHKALLAKALGDEIGLDISLIRGDFYNGLLPESHIWNELKLGNSYFLFDVEQSNCFVNLESDASCLNKYRYVTFK